MEPISKKPKNRLCVVHYTGFSSYSDTKDISQDNEVRMRNAKIKRETLKGENHHEEQCSLFPDIINNDVHGIHMIPCYKKFTLILAGESSVEKETRKTKRASIGNSSWVYPNVCNLCKKHRVQFQGKKVTPSTISTYNAEKSFKEAAEEKDKVLFTEIKDLDLIAKEFKFHEHCRKNFLRRKKTAKDSNQEEEKQSTGDYDSVVSFVEENIIQQKSVVSMKKLHEIYGLNTSDSRYRHKLKLRLEETFTDKISFMQPNRKCAVVVINSDSIEQILNTKSDPGSCIQNVATTIRDDILAYCSQFKDQHWPPTLETVTSEYGEPPASVKLFLKNILCSGKHKAESMEGISRFIESFCADLIHVVSKGNIMTPKHYLLGLGIHNMTGQKTPVQVINKLGHCISYEKTCEIETALAEIAIHQSNGMNILPLLPTENETILTYFWVDNFDVKVERLGGSGAVNTTHLMAFQESHARAPDIRKPLVSFKRSGRRKLLINEDQKVHTTNRVSSNPEPPKFNRAEVQAIDVLPSYDNQLYKLFFVWNFFRKQNSYDQLLPNFSGWLLRNRQRKIPINSLKKTIETYLPPITSKVTEFTTIETYIEYLEILSLSCNMPYVNITLDVGAAMNAFKFIWSNPERFENVVIHLGDFHFMKENFQILGMLVSSSGFEDVIFQSNVCSSGSLNGVLSASLYNKAWNVHEVMSEALERLLLKRFLAEFKPNLPMLLEDMAAEPETYDESLLDFCSDVTCEYEQFRVKVSSGEFGKTAQFWLMYLELMRLQHQARTAVQTNDFEMRLDAWNKMLPYYFTFNKTNYARYGSYYVQSLKQIDNRYKGLKVLLNDAGISVQAQETHPLRVSVDQRGEQTINRDAKTAGGIRMFASDKEAVLKWCLNRPEQSKNTNGLKNMAGLLGDQSTYKHLRPSYILKIERMITDTINVIENEYLNPFGVNLENDKLYNLSSGVTVNPSLADSILSSYSKGKELSQEFNERLIDGGKKFHDTISRNTIRSFKNAVKTCIVKKDSASSTVRVNRDIVASLLTFSAKHDKPIDWSSALSYSLSPIPLSISTADGARRETSKSKLLDLILKEGEVVLTDPKNETSLITNRSTFIIDLMAALRTMVQIPDTYEELTWKLLATFPKCYRRVDIVADTYHHVSIKSGEREMRGFGSKVIVQSPQSKIPRDFHGFLKNGENKTRLIELICKVISSNKEKAIQLLKCSIIYFSKEDLTLKIEKFSVTSSTDLSSNQEEADTKVILHCQHAIETTEGPVVLRSPSGDTDIFVIAVCLINTPERIFLDYGNGKNRKGLWLHHVSISEDIKRSLIGLHAYTGNDYVSAFFRKGKQACFKILKKNENLIKPFSDLGQNWDLSDELFDSLEEFTCLLYGYKKKDINKVRKMMFDKKYTKEGKIIDLASLPPCRSVLYLHSLRENYVAKMWKSSLSNLIDEPTIQDYGWEHNGEITWVQEMFPEDIKDILLDISYDEEDIELELEPLDESDDDEEDNEL